MNSNITNEEILEKLPKFNEMFDGMSEAIDDALHGEGSQRISKGVFSFKDGIKGFFVPFAPL